MKNTSRNKNRQYVSYVLFALNYAYPKVNDLNHLMQSMYPVILEQAKNKYTR